MGQELDQAQISDWKKLLEMKTWEEIINSGEIFINFLSRCNFFSQPYHGETEGLITTTPEIAIDYATNDSFEKFEEWESVTDSPDIFPDYFEWYPLIEKQLAKNSYWGFERANFNGIDRKFTIYDNCILKELMMRDIIIILNCYANNFFPSIWRDMVNIYLNDGFPCGWSDLKPNGKIVIFSNNQI